MMQQNLLASSATGSVYLTNHNVNAAKFGSGSAVANFRTGADGVATTGVNGVLTDVTSQWWTSGSTPGIGASYEVRMTPTSGTMSSGSATGTWLALSTAYSWSVTRSTLGSKTCIATAEIRNLGGTVLATATITLYAEFEA
jgi:hypothetical protein